MTAEAAEDFGPTGIKNDGLVNSATHTALEPEMPGRLRWYHGVASVGGVVAAPFSSGLYFYTLGTWGVVMVYGFVAIIGFVMNKLFAEMAGMFPNKPGGITIYASEAYTGKARFISVITTFGYWMGYSFALSFMATSVTYIVQAQWWAAGVPELTVAGFNLPADKLVSLGALLLAAVLAYLGPNVFARISLWLTGALGVVLVLACISPLFHLGELQLGTATFGSPGWETFAVMVYIVAFSVFGTELVATMAPAFRDIVHDTKRALRVAAGLVLISVLIVPIAATAVLGEDVVGLNPLNFPSLLVASIFGGSPFVVMAVNLVQIAMLLNLMIMMINGASQVLCAMAEEGLTIRQLGGRSKSGAPIVALVIAVVMNVALLLVTENPVAILLASNFGYVVAICLVVLAYIVLKRKSVHETLSGLKVRFGVPTAIVVLVVMVTALVSALCFPELAGGTFVQLSLAFVVMLLGVAGFLYRNYVQDESSEVVVV